MLVCIFQHHGAWIPIRRHHLSKHLHSTALIPCIQVGHHSTWIAPTAPAASASMEVSRNALIHRYSMFFFFGNGYQNQKHNIPNICIVCIYIYMILTSSHTSSSQWRSFLNPSDLRTSTGRVRHRSLRCDQSSRRPLRPQPQGRA